VEVNRQFSNIMYRAFMKQHNFHHHCWKFHRSKNNSKEQY
jgi:hypothetical protein